MDYSEAPTAHIFTGIIGGLSNECAYGAIITPQAFSFNSIMRLFPT